MTEDLHIDDVTSGLRDLSRRIFRTSISMNELARNLSDLQSSNDYEFDDSELEDIGFLYPDWVVKD